MSKFSFSGSVDSASYFLTKAFLRLALISAAIFNRDLGRPTSLGSTGQAAHEIPHHSNGNSHEYLLDGDLSELPHQVGLRYALTMRTEEMMTIAEAASFLIKNGVDTIDRMFNILNATDCPFTINTLRCVLSLYEGDDESHCLWRLEDNGRYHPLV